MKSGDPRRRASDELAELLATPEGLRTARLLQLTEALESRPVGDCVGAGETGSTAASRPVKPRAISIWQPRRRGAELIFERPEPHPLGDHYAQRRVLVAEKSPGTTRICYFGESAAAGYLYAPHLTPAEVLEQKLCTAEGAYEVVDLARTNETLDSMVRTIESSRQLAPDLLVIFAGDNWNLLETPLLSPYVPSVKSRQRLALALRRDGLAGLMELGRRDLAARVKRAMAAVAELADDVPVIVVVPEVNLADWQDRQPVAWLPEDGSRRWHEQYREALGHLDADRGEAALQEADGMVGLDGGLCPTSHRLRAEALTSLGRTDEARRASQAEVECGRYATQCFLGSPRMAASESELLRREAARHGFAVVDLPRLFAGEKPPGRRLFLDYCHLSAEGFERAMAAVAETILAGERPDASPAVALSAPEVEPAVEALARVGAAVHGAHRLLTSGDKRAYLEQWCREALAADPGAAETLRDLLAVRCTAPCPAVLTEAQQQSLRRRHRLLLQHGWRWNHLDAELIEAICAALEDAGHAVRAEIEASLLTHHSPRPRGVELSRPPYLWEPLERFYPEAMAPRGITGRATYRSPWPESSFCLIVDGARDVQLVLVVRLPAIVGAPSRRQGEVAVQLNGHDVTGVKVGETWSRHTIRLARGDLGRVIHRVTLRWPPLPDCGDEAFENAIRRLENGVEADLHPVFGEVFSLRAT